VYAGGVGSAEEVRNTKRDAILGAAAGAAIGGAYGRDRLKGAVIGAAAGGVLGAIYGQKVDVKKIPR
jgi:outer membrane lipoprotein SlyB